MKLEQSELTTMKRLIKNVADRPDDFWAKEELSQYMEDIGIKYKIKLSNHTFNMDTGEIIENKN